MSPCFFTAVRSRREAIVQTAGSYFNTKKAELSSKRKTMLKKRCFFSKTSSFKSIAANRRSPLEEREILKSPVSLEQQDGLKIDYVPFTGFKLDNKGPYYSPPLSAMFAVPSKAIEKSGISSILPVEIRLEGESIQLNWALRADRKPSEIRLDGPIVGTAENKAVGVGGSLFRRVTAEGEALLESKANLVFTVDKAVSLQGIIDPAKIDDVRKLLSDCKVAITVDETVVEAADSNEGKNLPLSKPLQVFLKKQGALSRDTK